jgi:hypothetical protein
VKHKIVWKRARYDLQSRAKRAGGVVQAVICLPSLKPRVQILILPKNKNKSVNIF